MSNEKYIEDSFREKFGDSAISNEGWNEPSDAIWSKIENDLAPNDRPRLIYPFYMLLSGFLIALLFMGMLLHQNKKMNNRILDMQHELRNCGDQNQSLDIPTVKSQSFEANPHISRNTQEPITKPFLNENKMDALDVNKEKIPLKTKRENKIIRASYEAYSSKDDDENINLIVDESDVYDEELDLGTREPLQIISLLIEKPKLLLGKDLHLNFSPDYVIDPINQFIPRSFVSISSGVLINELNNFGNQGTALSELIDNEYADLGYALNMKYTKEVHPRLSVSVGAGVSYQKFVTEYDISLPYEIGEEILDGGIGYIDFEHSLPTSFGYTDTQLRLRRSNVDVILEETNVDIDFDTKHELISVFVPLSIDYLFGDLSNGFYTGFDIMPSYIASARSSISSVISRHSEIQSVNNDAASEYKTLRRYNLAIGGHIGYRFAFSESNGLEMNAAYTRNIGAHFKTDSFTSSSHGVQFNAGYYFRF